MCRTSINATTTDPSLERRLEETTTKKSQPFLAKLPIKSEYIQQVRKDVINQMAGGIW